MEAMRSQILNETSTLMKELIVTMQQQLMTDVQVLIKASLAPLMQMLTDLTTHHRAAAQNITPEQINKINNKNLTRLRSSARGAQKQ